MPKSKTDHEITKKSIRIGGLFRDFVLSCFRDPLRFWIGIGNPTPNTVALRKS